MGGGKVEENIREKREGRQIAIRINVLDLPQGSRRHLNKIYSSLIFRKTSRKASSDNNNI